MTCGGGAVGAAGAGPRGDLEWGMLAGSSRHSKASRVHHSNLNDLGSASARFHAQKIPSYTFLNRK